MEASVLLSTRVRRGSGCAPLCRPDLTLNCWQPWEIARNAGSLFARGGKLAFLAALGQAGWMVENTLKMSVWDSAGTLAKRSGVVRMVIW